MLLKSLADRSAAHSLSTLQEGLRGLFEAAGFACESLHMVERTISNRARGLAMERRWIQGTFVKRQDGHLAHVSAHGSSAAEVSSPSDVLALHRRLPWAEHHLLSSL